MLLDSLNGYKVPTPQVINREMNEVVAYLRNAPGISNVGKKVDLDNYILSVNFTFKDVSNINHLNEAVLKKLKVKSVGNSAYSFNTSQLKFQRSYQYNPKALQEYSRLKPDVKNVFKEATYTSIYRFQNPVSSVTNPLAKVSKTKKAVMLNTGVQGLIYGKTNISNTITLTR